MHRGAKTYGPNLDPDYEKIIPMFDQQGYNGFVMLEHEGTRDPGELVPGYAAQLGWLVAGIGLAGSFLSGLLGVGGAAFIVPMLLYVPPLLGTGQLDIRMATGMSIVLVFVSAASSGWAHRHRSLACPGVARTLAPATAVGSLVGGLLSGTVPAVGAVTSWSAGTPSPFR